MPKDLVFVQGESLKSVQNREERRRIRSNIIRASWRSKRRSDALQDPSVGEEEQEQQEQDSYSVPGPEPVRSQSGTLHRIPCRVPGSTLESPRSILSAARTDPFSTNGLDRADMFGQGMLDYCFTDLWPVFRPDGNYARDFARFWFPRAAQNATVMAAILFSATVHQEIRVAVEDYDSVSLPNSNRLLRLKGAAITTLRDDLSGGVAKEKIDETIYAILCLAVNQHASLATIHRSPDQTNFDAPFLEAQWLTMYASMAFDPTHFAAIQALVRRKGGIQNVGTYSVGWLVFFAGLMAGANLLLPPAFPPVDMSGQPYAFQSPLRLLRVFEMPYHFRLPEAGFHLFEKTALRPNIIQTFLDVSEMSQAINVYIQDAKHARSLADILDSRSDLTYRLLCLPSTTEVAFASEERPPLQLEQSMNIPQLYLCVRLVAQLYCLHVIFPMPRVASIRQQLVPMVREIVEWFDGKPAEVAHKQILLWACMITALAVWGESLDMDRWSVTRCTRLTTGLGITAYQELKTLLHVFGWIDSACDKCGVAVWAVLMSNEMA